MRKIIFSPLAQDTIIAYIASYRRYFFRLYTDTGIWSEEQILIQYAEQALAREREIFELIKTRFIPEIVHGRHLDNTISLLWRSKILWLQWEDRGEERIIIDLKISEKR